MDNSKAQVEIATFNWINEAELARIQLEAESIHAEITESNIAIANPLLANATGGIKLKVSIDEADRAYEILERNAKENSINYKPWCPKCDSENVVKKELSVFLKVITVITLGLLSLIFAESFSCRDCGNKWR